VTLLQVSKKVKGVQNRREKLARVD